MKWPLVWRATLEAVEAERDAALAKLTRRSIRRANKLTKPIPATEPEPVSEEGTVSADLPPQVVEAIEARVPRNSRARAMMVGAALKAIEAGEPADRVAEYMWRGEPE